MRTQRIVYTIITVLLLGLAIYLTWMTSYGLAILTWGIASILLSETIAIDTHNHKASFYSYIIAFSILNLVSLIFAGGAIFMYLIVIDVVAFFLAKRQYGQIY